MRSSLIVPAYNEENIIEDTLDHLTDLEPYFEEIYLVDDASTDGTRDIIDSYLEENETEVKITYMRENGDKIGAIDEAVRHVNSENIILTDADTRLKTPDNITDAEDHMSENGYGALAFKVVPDDSTEGTVDEIWNGLQDLDYAMGRVMAGFTTGEKFRLDPDDKNVRCIAGAGGIYDADILEDALNHHSGKHAGDDMETTAITQLLLDENVDYFSNVEFETEVPKDYNTLRKQRQRWSRGSIQAFSEHPVEYLKESATLSRYGQTVIYEAGISAAAPVFLGKAAIDVTQGDIGQAAESLSLWYGLDASFTGLVGAFSAKKNELKDNKNLGLTPLMPLYRASTFFPAKIGSQGETVMDKKVEAIKAFNEGFEEGNENFGSMRTLGKSYEKSLQGIKDVVVPDSWKDTEKVLEESGSGDIVAAD